jgi:hypothetical protein
VIAAPGAGGASPLDWVAGALRAAQAVLEARQTAAFGAAVRQIWHPPAVLHASHTKTSACQPPTPHGWDMLLWQHA